MTSGVLVEIVWSDDRLKSLLDRRAVENRQGHCVSCVFHGVPLRLSWRRFSADSWFSSIGGGLSSLPCAQFLPVLHKEFSCSLCKAQTFCSKRRKRFQQETFVNPPLCTPIGEASEQDDKLSLHRQSV